MDTLLLIFNRCTVSCSALDLIIGVGLTFILSSAQLFEFLLINQLGIIFIYLFFHNFIDINKSGVKS